MRFITLLFAIIFSLSLSSCATRVVERRPNRVVVVKTPPKNYKVVNVKGKRYYTWNGKHYRKTRKGYVIVKL